MYRSLYRWLIAVAFLSITIPAPALGGIDQFIGEMIWVPFNFAPKGWAFCDGQLLPIAQNTALFSLLGTTYGGDGKTTFALPDMQGRTMVGNGQGNSLSPYVQGETSGTETVTLLTSEMPPHNHNINVYDGMGNTSTPTANTVYARAESGKLYGTVRTQNMSASTIGAIGSNQPHNNMMPYQTLNCIIALQGVFPQRQ